MWKLYPWIKFDLLSGVYQVLSSPSDRLRILCGDFNTPQAEKPNGEIITWGYTKGNDRYFLTRSGQYQHELEMSILRGLGEYHDLPDVYRRFHGYDNCGSEEGWSWQNRLGSKYRYDHIFASKSTPSRVLCTGGHFTRGRFERILQA